jgi:thymidylate kinase
MVTVALVGPDGSGKSTVARRLVDELGLPVRTIYMGVSAESSDVLLPTTRLARRLKRWTGSPPDTAGPRDPARPRRRGGSPLRRAARGARGIARLGNRLAEEWYRQLVATRSSRAGRVVVFDRHFLADYHAYDVAATERSVEQRIHGWALRRLPRPDLVIYLDAPAEVLLARKGEGSLEVLERRRGDYLALRGVVPRFAVVDATQPLDAVVAEVAALIREAADRRRDLPARRRPPRPRPPAQGGR